MSPPTVPSDDFSDLAALANRIAQHIRKNPNDAEAKSDYAYVQQQLGRQGTGGALDAANAQEAPPAETNTGAAKTSGLVQSGIDQVSGFANLFLHPIQTIGQMTGVGNYDKYLQVSDDPEASFAEKADAAIRATPLNMGYGPMRSLMEATGANPYHPSDPNYGEAEGPADTKETWRRMGNVAAQSLLALGADPAKAGTLETPIRAAQTVAKLPFRIAGRVTGLNKLIGSRLAGVPDEKAPPAPPSQADLAEQLGTKEPMRAPHPDAAKAIQDFEAGRLDEQGLRDALDQAAGRPFEARPQVAPTVPSDAAPPPPVVPATEQAGSGGAKVLPFVRPTIKELATLPGGTPPPAPGLRAGEAASPIAGTEGRGIEVTGSRATPAVPKTPTMLEMQEGRPQHPIFSGERSFTRSPEVRQGEPLTPSTAGMPRTAESPAGAGLPPATQEGFAKLFGQPESFEGGGFGRVRQIMQSPMYQQAGSLARQFLRDPELTAKFPEFAGMDAPTLTRALQRMIVEQGQESGNLPALTSLKSFLGKLTGVGGAGPRGPFR